VAGLVGRVAFWEILPGRSGAQYPEDTVEDLAWISPGSSSSVFSSRWIWDEWLQYFPLLVCEVHAALVLLLEGHMTAPLYPHFRIYEIASRKMNVSVRVHNDDLELEIATPAISQSEDPS
jgi:hypothetical protein